MKLLHVTHNKNIGSIIKNGLMPSFIEHSGHWECFQDYLEHRRCVYLWDAETYRNDKFVRDLIYTKMFIHPRNKMFVQREIEIENAGLDIYDEDHYIDFSKLGTWLVGDVGTFSVLEIDSEGLDLHGSWQHVQEPTSNRHATSTIMDDKYAHDDKEIYITGDTIGFNNIKIVEEVLVRKNKSNNLGFTFRKK